MPRGDGTGPPGGNFSRRKGGRGAAGRMGRGGGFALGPGGECVCPECAYRQPHTRGVPCNSLKCPKCGTPMTRA